MTPVTRMDLWCHNKLHSIPHVSGVLFGLFEIAATSSAGADLEFEILYDVLDCSEDKRWSSTHHVPLSTHLGFPFTLSNDYPIMQLAISSGAFLFLYFSFVSAIAVRQAKIRQDNDYCGEIVNPFTGLSQCVCT